MIENVRLDFFVGVFELLFLANLLLYVNNLLTLPVLFKAILYSERRYKVMLDLVYNQI